MSLTKQIDDIKQKKAEIVAEESLILNKALSSTNPSAIVKANAYFEQLEEAKSSHFKSYLFDPYQFYNSLGYKNRPAQLSYYYLRSMASQPIIRSIIETRKDQISAFSEPVTDEQKAGWMIRKKRGLFGDKNKELTKQDQNRIEDITEFIMNTGITDGERDRKWSADTFEGFLRKVVKDSLEMDQMTFEMVYSRGGKLQEFIATDGATFRIADQVKDEKKTVQPIINGYPPTYVQIYQNQVVQDFYPWELCFGIRNQSTNIYNNGYGISELEDLIKTITWMLYGDQYNGNFFSQGASPKGILKVSGNIATSKLNQFRQQWQLQVVGVQNAWKTPVIESDKMEWIDLQKSNTDMQFQEWNQYLRAVACAVFKIDPSEIGFPQSQGGSNLFGSSGVKDRLDHSRQKGLVPLLRFLQRKFTKHIVEQLDSNYEFVFTGVSPEDEDHIVELDNKKLNYYTLNEVRELRNLPKIDGGDIPMNPTFIQAKQMDMMGGQESNEYVDEETGEENGNMYKKALGGENPFEEELKNKAENDNPILDGFNNFMEKINNK